MTSTTSYNNATVVTGEVEYPATDPASGAFFQPDFKKNDDLKIMLDGSKDSLKLEAMKRIIGMIAKGRDASDLFPAVVKNVVSKNIEVKKLVYVYLVRYAEEQQDLALLSISTFQRALKDPNQLIRASALRVLSSIRVPMIVPIVMLAIRDSSSDMSPYVRKTAAHAIPKLYSLDPDQKEELVQVIDKLLSDKAPLVVGSAAMAFSEVCGDRIELLHRSFRKLCGLLADVDEWGQLTLLNVLTVYARTCFVDPNNGSNDSSESSSELSAAGSARRPRARALEPDHRLLLRAAKPLLQSRNSGVVLATAQLFCHCAPVQEMAPVAKAMVRLLRAPVEVQSVVLNCIASITVTQKFLFEPYLKSFFVRNSEPTHIKLVKLQILTNLATEASAGVVLRELLTHAASADAACAGAAVQAVGRLAVAVESETHTCLTQLLHLLSSKDERVVCSAVVVVKRVVGGGTCARAAVARAARLLRADRLAGSARAAAVWLLAEHGAAQPRAAAVLAHLAKTFDEQEELVKLQLLSLAMKLSITQVDTLPLCRYILSLARYDVSYDVRDKARMLRKFVESDEGVIVGCKRDVFCPDKPKPVVQSSFKDRQQYTVGTLSQYLGCAASGYRPLPPAPPAALPAALRDDVTALRDASPSAPHVPKNKTFYSEPESSASGSSSSSGSSSEESSDEEESSDDSKSQEKPKQINNSEYSAAESGTSDSDPASSPARGVGGAGGGSDATSSDDEPRKAHDKKPTQTSKASDQAKSNLALLLELDAAARSLPTMTPVCGGFLTPQSYMPVDGDDAITPTGPSYTATLGIETVSRVVTNGYSLSRRWVRTPHLYSQTMCAIEMQFTNHSNNDVQHIRVNKKIISGSRSIHEWPIINSISPGASARVTLGVDFADSIQPVEFTVVSSVGEVTVSITPPVGELMRAVSMSEARWDAEQRKLRGMNECDKKALKLENEQDICKRVFETANLAPITSTGNLLRFAGRMLSSQDLVLLSVRLESDCARVVANCANMAIASLLANDVAQAFAKP